MSRPLVELEAEIRALDPAQQDELLRLLLDETGSIEKQDDIDRAWIEEVQRRSREIDSGSVTPISAEDVFSRAAARLSK